MKVHIFANGYTISYKQIKDANYYTYQSYFIMGTTYLHQMI